MFYDMSAFRFIVWMDLYIYIVYTTLNLGSQIAVAGGGREQGYLVAG